MVNHCTWFSNEVVDVWVVSINPILLTHACNINDNCKSHITNAHAWLITVLGSAMKSYIGMFILFWLKCPPFIQSFYGIVACFFKVCSFNSQFYTVRSLHFLLKQDCRFTWIGLFYCHQLFKILGIKNARDYNSHVSICLHFLYCCFTGSHH